MFVDAEMREVEGRYGLDVGFRQVAPQTETVDF